MTEQPLNPLVDQAGDPLRAESLELKIQRYAANCEVTALAADIYTNNAATNAQLRESVQRIDKEFIHSLARISSLLEPDGYNPEVTELIRQLISNNLDHLVIRQSPNDQTGDPEAQTYVEFSKELIITNELPQHVTLSQPVRDLFSRSAALAATEILKTQSFQQDMISLRKSQPPRIEKDRPAVDVACKIFAAVRVTCSGLLDNQIHDALKLADDKHSEISGLTATVLNHIHATVAAQIIGVLATDPDLKANIGRIVKAIDGIKFSRKTASLQNIAKFNNGELFFRAMQLDNTRTPIISALSLHLNQQPLETLKCWLADIPEEQLIPLDSKPNELFRYQKPIRIVVKAPNDPDLAICCTFKPGISDVSLLLMTSIEKAPTQKQIRYNLNYGFNTTHKGDLTIIDISNTFPMEQGEIDLIFSSNPALRDIKQTVQKLASHALWQLRKAEKLAPDILSRVAELPSNLVLLFDEDQIVVEVTQKQLPEFLKLFEYDQVKYEELVKATKLDPQTRKGPKEEPKAYQFTLYISKKQAQDAPSDKESEATADTSGDDLRARLHTVMTRNRINTFNDLYSFLKKEFEVSLTDQGKGSHMSLIRGSRNYTTSQRFRDHNRPIKTAEALEIFTALGIDPDEAIAKLPLGDHVA